MRVTVKILNLSNKCHKLSLAFKEHPLKGIPKDYLMLEEGKNPYFPCRYNKLCLLMLVQFLMCFGLVFRSNVVSCAKHFVGDGGTTGGIDESNTVASYKSLRSIHLRPYYDAIAYGVSTIMISYSSWNGVKMSANQYLINHILKQRMGFQVITIFSSNVSRFSVVISTAVLLLICIGFHNIGLGGSGPDCHSG